MGSDIMLRGPLGSSPAAEGWLGILDPCGMEPGDFSKVGQTGEDSDGSLQSFLLRAQPSAGQQNIAKRWIRSLAGPGT